MTSACTDIQMLQQAFHWWCHHLSNQNLEQLIALYEPEAILLPTLADSMIQDHQERWAYFERLMQNPNLKVTVKVSKARILDNVGINSGFYTFSFDGQNGPVELPSRFTFIYRRHADGWRIIDHHSSQVPFLPST